MLFDKGVHALDSNTSPKIASLLQILIQRAPDTHLSLNLQSSLQQRRSLDGKIEVYKGRQSTTDSCNCIQLKQACSRTINACVMFVITCSLLW